MEIGNMSCLGISSIIGFLTCIIIDSK